MPKSTVRSQPETEPTAREKASPAKSSRQRANGQSKSDKAAKSPKSVKTERLDARLTSEQKELLQRAAVLEGCSMTDFVSRAIQEASMRTIERHQVLKLGIEDSIRFVEALLNPPEPSENLKAAFHKYHDAMGNSHT